MQKIVSQGDINLIYKKITSIGQMSWIVISAYSDARVQTPSYKSNKNIREERGHYLT